MIGQPRRRRISAVFVASLVIGLTSVPALLDASEAPRATQVESEHDPATCGAHDHALCVQLAGSRLLPAAEVARPGDAGIGYAPDAGPAEPAPSVRHPSPRPPARAPPAV